MPLLVQKPPVTSRIMERENEERILKTQGGESNSLDSGDFSSAVSRLVIR